MRRYHIRSKLASQLGSHELLSSAAVVLGTLRKILLYICIYVYVYTEDIDICLFIFSISVVLYSRSVAQGLVLIDTEPAGFFTEWGEVNLGTTDYLSQPGPSFCAGSE